MKQNTHLLAQVEISDGRGRDELEPEVGPAPLDGERRGRRRPRSTAQTSRASPELKWKSITSRTALAVDGEDPVARPEAGAAGVAARRHRRHHHALRLAVSLAAPWLSSDRPLRRGDSAA